MTYFEEAIVDLLLKHNCVIVPAFGGFVAQSTNAVVDVRNGVMFPPKKSVLFNRQLINNDGLLTHYLAAAKQCSFQEADVFLKERVSSWNQALKQGQRVTIDRIGYLYLDAERNVSFEQDRFFNLLLQSYGLTKVHFIGEEDVKRVEAFLQPQKSIPTPKIETAEPKEIKVDFSKKEIPMPASMPESASNLVDLDTEDAPSSSNAWKYIAAAVLLPFAFYTYWIPMKTNVLESGMISSYDFNPTYQAGEGVYQKKRFSFSLTKEKVDPTLNQAIESLPKKVEVYFYKYADDLYIPVRLNESAKKSSKETKAEVQLVKAEISKPIVIESKPKTEETKKQNDVSSTKTEKHPQWIVGCFSDASNAKQLVEAMKAKGLPSEIADVKNGLSRVSAGGSKNAAEMQKIQAKAKALGYDGWLLK